MHVQLFHNQAIVTDLTEQERGLEKAAKDLWEKTYKCGKKYIFNERIVGEFKRILDSLRGGRNNQQYKPMPHAYKKPSMIPALVR